MRRTTYLCLAVLLCACAPAAIAYADEITDWNKHMLATARAVTTPAAPNPNPVIMTRIAAIVQSAVFDAVNGIERRYTPIHVEPHARRGASKRAAAIQAAYVTLLAMYPTQAGPLLEKRNASLAAISTGEAAESSVSIALGVEWGHSVANQILAWRSTDGFTATFPPFVPGTAAGDWVPTAAVPGTNPPQPAAPFGRNFAVMTPWVLESPDQFRAPGPPALGSAKYRADFDEVRIMGRDTSLDRTADQSAYAVFWNVGTATDYWHRIAVSFSESRHLTLSQNSRLLAALSLVMADAAIGCWDTKFNKLFWRPVTAISLAAPGMPFIPDDGDAATLEDVTWKAFIPTPNHPDYPSGHSCVSGAAGRLLSIYFGDSTPFSLESFSTPGEIRTYQNLTHALEEIKNARTFSGIHFRSACDDGQKLGIDVTDYILGKALRPVNGKKAGQVRR